MNTKHKLSGYCIRGGRGISERIRKVFEADGVGAVRKWGYDLDSDFYHIDDDGCADLLTGLSNRTVEHLTEITIDEAEAIVYGTPEKTFPREMLVSDGLNDPIDDWHQRTIITHLKGKEYPWISPSIGNPQLYVAYRFAREIPETIPYNRAKEIISKATDKGVDDCEIECKTE